MTKRFWLSSVSAFVVFAGGALLSTPAPAAAEPEVLGCTDAQRSYVRSVIAMECSCGGIATFRCDGHDVYDINVACYVCPDA